MPLLNKRLFEPNPVPDGVDGNTRVFYCKHTNEVFLTHEEYFNRLVLLNSTTWSCALTRKTNLTFFEAMASEAEAERELIDFPMELELPILYIVHKLTNRGRFEELVNDIYHIIRDRYFLNEVVAFSDRSRKFTARIVGAYNMDDGLTASGSEQKEPVMPAADSYRYTVEFADDMVMAGNVRREDVTCDRLFRSKNVGARQKIRLFLKNACHMPHPGDRYTIKDVFLERLEFVRWNDIMAGPEPICPQTPVLQRGRIPNMLKPGYAEPEKKEKKPPKEEKDPNAPPRPRGRPPKTPEQRAQWQEEKEERKPTRKPDDFDLTSSGALTLTVTPPKKQRKPRVSNAAKNEKKQAKIQEQQDDLEFYFSEAHRLGIDVTGLEKAEKLLNAKVVAEFKQKVKDQKDVEREQAKEEKRRKVREKAAYNKKREDLLCNDLKPMPRLPRLETPSWLTDDEFGDCIFILQFFSSFQDILPLKEIRGSEEITFSDIVLAIKCNDPQNSPFADLMRVLLSVRTDIADEEDGDEADFANKDEVNLLNTQSCDPGNSSHGDSIRERSDLHFRIRKIHGKSVRHLPVDWMTLSEVLRLIFETSGYYTGMATHRHRLYARGNFRGYEDPAFEFRSTQPEILEKLKTQTVFDLEPSERLEIVKTIIYQLLTYVKFRAHLEKMQNELFELKKEQKRLKTWDVGQEAEANAARLLLEVESTNGTEVASGTVDDALVKRFKAHIKANNEGRRFDKEDMDSILLESVPYSHLTLDEIVTARELQKTEHSNIMTALVGKIFSIDCKVSCIQLGSDRAFRRYQVIENLSALLVESPHPSEQMVHCDEPSVIDDPQNLVENDEQQVFRCTGDMADCQVHGALRLQRSRWCYVQSREQLESLMQALNPRGNRENELTEAFNEYKPSLMEMLEETERARCDGDWQTELMTEDPDPADTYNIDWDAEIRDLLLDFEEKLDQGQMGSVEKTFLISRAVWREKLKNDGDVCGLLKETVKIGSEVGVEVGVEYSDVKKLAIAFLLIVKSISFKFIKTPFCSPSKDEHGNSKSSELFLRWQKALLQCESLSAVSLFISTVESAIKWDKSRLQGKCQSCRRKAAAHELVLCSECDRCYHLKCAKLSVETDDWLCTTCRAYHRKEENEAKRLRRAERAVEEPAEVTNGNTSIAESEPETSKVEEPKEPVSTVRTSSGRAVKRVQYSDINEGPSLKSRKSNGSTPSVQPSERPVRGTSLRIFDFDDENGLTDEESYIENTSRKRKPTIKKDSSAPKTAIEAARLTKEKMSAIEALLKETMRQECSWPFMQPVDAKEVPDYYDVIKRPMDLRTMMNKIKQRVYNNPVEVRNDFQLILANCEIYNETESEIYQLSQELHQFAAFRLDAIIDK